MTGRWLMALALFALATPLPASAQLEQVLAAPVASSSAPAAEAGPAIADTQDEGADARIAERIRGIFSELPAFEGVEVAVTQGVVSLSGTVPKQADVARAEGIAARVSGVVTVENGLERDVSLATNAGGIGSLRDRARDVLKLLPLLGAAALVGVLIALAGYGLARLTGLWRRVTPNSFLAELIASAIRFVFVIAGLVVALRMLGATALLGAVLGGAGVIGIALGFAMRDTIQNYVASLLLSLRQPFRANDHVAIDDLEGRVIRLTSRATILMTLDGNHLRIPNAKVFNGVILNYSRNPARRFEFDIALDPGADALAARQLGREALAGLDFVLPEPPPDAQVVAVGEPNGTARYFAWVDQRKTDWGKARSLAIVAVKQALDEHKLLQPAPVYRVKLDLRDSAEAPPAQPASPPVSSESTAPDKEVANMVAAERATAPAADRDLLDSDCPVE